MTVPSSSAEHAPALEARPELPGETVSRVAMTPAALELIRRLLPIHGPLMFHQSGGCCDGSAPMCFPVGEFRTGDADVLLGTATLDDASGEELGELELWISREQFGAWKHTRLLIDAVPGRGAGFSLDNARDRHFVLVAPTCAG